MRLSCNCYYFVNLITPALSLYVYESPMNKRSLLLRNFIPNYLRIQFDLDSCTTLLTMYFTLHWESGPVLSFLLLNYSISFSEVRLARGIFFLKKMSYWSYINFMQAILSTRSDMLYDCFWNLLSCRSTSLVELSLLVHVTELLSHPFPPGYLPWFSLGNRAKKGLLLILAQETVSEIPLLSSDCHLEYKASIKL